MTPGPLSQLRGRIRQMRSTPPHERILFVHIPKTAGMSLYDALRRWAGRGRAVRFPNGGPADLAAWLDLPESRVSELRLVSGHLAYEEFLKRDLHGWWPITILRDPVVRTLSTYTYMRDERRHPWHRLVAPMDLEGFLDWYESRPANLDQQCGFISPSRRAEDALVTLRTHFVLCGTVDDLGPLYDAVSRLLGAPIRAERHNRSRRPIDPADLPASTIGRIRSMHRQDAILYQAVRSAGLVGLAAGADAPALPSACDDR